MRLNKSKGNMSKFLTHTWPVIKGCRYGCTYCWAERLAPRYGGNMQSRLVESQLEGTLNRKELIIGVAWDGEMWGPWIPKNWIKKVLRKIKILSYNTFVPLTKNPSRYGEFINQISSNMILGVTIESNKFYQALSNAPAPQERYEAMKNLEFKKFIIIEPILKFDLEVLTKWIIEINPVAVEIGADSGNNQLPEPLPEEIHKLVKRLRYKTTVLLKSNLFRLYDPQQKKNIVKCPYESQKHFFCMQQRTTFPNWRKGCNGKVDYTQCSVYIILKARSKLEEIQ